MKGDTRCIDGRLQRHVPQQDDPDLETDIGECPECQGEGRNCHICGRPHAEEVWRVDMPVPGKAQRMELTTHVCSSCGERRRDAMAEVEP